MRYKVGEAVVIGELEVNETARTYGVSAGFVSKCAKLFRARHVINGFRNRCEIGTDIFRSTSNRPKTIRPVYTEDDVRNILTIRTEFPFFGSAKIRVKIMERGFNVPSLRTIDMVLRKNDMMGEKRDRHFGKTYGSFEREHSLSLVQIDYKDLRLDINGNLICSIWVLDDCSRAILGVKVSDRHSADDVIELLEGVMAMFGKPRQILSDHGSEFYSIRNGKGASKLDRWCGENGIEHIMGRVKHPQTQGKIERSHGSALKEITAFGSMETLDEAGETTLRWIAFYNTERPHQSIDYEYPMERFFARMEDIFPFIDPSPAQVVVN